MSSSPLPSPIGTPGISSPYPSSRLRPVPSPSPPPSAHIKSTDDWTRERDERWRETWMLGCEIATHSYPFVKMTLFCYASHFLASSHMARSGREGKLFSRQIWKAVRTPLVIFLFAFAASVFRYMFGLFKKNGISSTLSCFFIDRTWKISSENEPFSPSHMCVYIVFTQMPSDIFIYTSFLCGGGDGKSWRRDEGIISMKEHR